jgi:hypothetical protein
MSIFVIGPSHPVTLQMRMFMALIGKTQGKEKILVA